MYKKVTCWGTGNTYLVTDTRNIPMGGGRFYTRDEDGYYEPTYTRSRYIINKTDVKPSIYKREWPYYKRDEYKYAFTERTTKVTRTDKDVYYNDRRNKFISKTRTSSDYTTEYGLPRLIVW